MGLLFRKNFSMHIAISKIYDLYRENPKISTDSRKIEPKSLFFALKGDNFNGNAFAKQALESGASYSIIDDPEFNINDKCILVDNVLTTLQSLASIHRNSLKIPIVGITGSNGKTTTKELLYSVLSQKYRTLATLGNLNNHIGVPITILSIMPEHEFAIIEMGANHVGEIGELCKISKPNFGIITNIGKAHIGEFGGIDGVIKTKNDLYLSVKQSDGTVFVNQNNNLLIQLSSEIRRFTYGNCTDADYFGDMISCEPFLDLFFKYENISYEIKTKIFGAYNFENVMAAVSVGLHFKIDPNAIVRALENYIPSNNRSQIIKTNKNTVIMDAYNANPTSMKYSIENFLSQKNNKKLLILGDMLELGEFSDEEHLNIIKLLNDKEFHKAIFVGETFYKLNYSADYSFFKNTDDLIPLLKETNLDNALILLKGSRKIGLEKLLPFL